MTHTAPSGEPILVVFCRRPAPGVGKQRIAAVIGSEPTQRLAGYLLATALEDAAAWPGEVVLAPAAPEDLDWARTAAGRPVTVVLQQGANLGERIAYVDREVRRAGGQHLFYIGSDAPLLDYAYYARARLALDHADIVLGPAEDGGVTLMAARLPWPGIDDLPWSSGLLCEALDRRCRACGLRVARLDSRYDVDEAWQLPRLYLDLAGDPRPARLALRAWLAAAGLAHAPTGTAVMP